MVLLWVVRMLQGKQLSRLSAASGEPRKNGWTWFALVNREYAIRCTTTFTQKGSVTVGVGESKDWILVHDLAIRKKAIS